MAAWRESSPHLSQLLDQTSVVCADQFIAGQAERFAVALEEEIKREAILSAPDQINPARAVAAARRNPADGRPRRAGSRSGPANLKCC